MGKKALILVALVLTSMLLVTPTSCNNTPSIDDSIVQIWEPAGSEGGEGTLLAFGVAVGDGSQVLTVLNYEGYSPGSLEVGLPGQEREQASIQAIDPRTSVTLLKLEGAKMPAAAIGEPDNLKSGSEVVVHGWPGPDYSSLKSMATSFPGYEIALMIDVGNEGYIANDGATVTDENGKVIGLIGTFYNAFVYRLGGPGMAAPIININSALELLLPDATNQPWAKGPAFSLITTKDTVTGQASSEPVQGKYNELTAALHLLLGTMDEPLPSDELPDDYRSFLWGGPESIDGSLLSVLYPHPIELWNTGGSVVAEAKWVGIQWGRSEGKPNRLFYGYIDVGKAIIEGGFILNGDVTGLENTLH